MQSYLIDAYNLMHAVPALRVRVDRHAASRRLVTELGAWAAGRPVRVVLVFDGAKPPDMPPAGPLELRFMLERADADLMDLLDRRGSHTVVSADSEIVDYARALGHASIRPQDFWRALSEASLVDTAALQRERPLAADEVDYWLEEFGDQAALARRRAARDAMGRPRHRTSGSQSASGKGTGAGRGGGMPRDEVADWLRYFGEAPPED